MPGKRLIILFCCLNAFYVNAQPPNNPCQIMFYNVENLFDTIDDPITNDNEFLPEGSKKWNNERYHQKLIEISKVIIAAGRWNPPTVIGLSEIENQTVLEDLINLTPLSKLNYDYIHHDSQDKRGIDVGLIYRKDIITPISSASIHIDINPPTRDILLFSGQIGHDTVFFFVNHWPSRISGKEHTEFLRIKASNVLIKNIDSLYSLNKNAKIVVIGDFNDEPNDSSLTQLMKRPFKDSNDSTYFFIGPIKEKDIGTTVYTDVFRNWYFFDQILISDNIIIASEHFILKLPWLLSYQGGPNRTYLGNYYNGGISDHLPVIISLYLNDLQSRKIDHE